MTRVQIPRHQSSRIELDEEVGDEEVGDEEVGDKEVGPAGDGRGLSEVMVWICCSRIQ